MTDLFERQPWNTEFTGIAGLPPGMLGHYEASLLYHLARDHYRGHGDIVDAGAFLGASSWCFTRGVAENALIRNKVGRIHAYDLFQVWSEPGGTDAGMAAWLKRHYGIELAHYESTIGIYAANLGALAGHVRIHQGDILKERWSGRPIEFLFVDICKIKPIWLHLIRSFFPSLIPGISLVVHQDWHHPWLPYLHVGQEALAAYFELLVPKANDTAVFRLIDRIPERVLERVANYEFSEDEEHDLIAQAVARFAEHGKASFIRLAQAELFRQYGHFDRASEIVHNAVVQTPEPMSKEERSWFEAHAAGVAARIEADGMNEAPEGFARRYIAANPNLTHVIESGHFRSAYHHWYRHGRWEGRAPAPDDSLARVAS